MILRSCATAVALLAVAVPAQLSVLPRRQRRQFQNDRAFQRALELSMPDAASLSLSLPLAAMTPEEAPEESDTDASSAGSNDDGDVLLDVVAAPDVDTGGGDGVLIGSIALLSVLVMAATACFVNVRRKHHAQFNETPLVMIERPLSEREVRARQSRGGEDIRIDLQSRGGGDVRIDLPSPTHDEEAGATAGDVGVPRMSSATMAVV